MNKIVLISGYSKLLVTFRGDLIRSWLNLGYKVYAIAPETEFRDEILATGVTEFYALNVNRTGVNVFADFQYTYRLYKLLKQLAPDYTLGYNVKPALYGAIAAKMARVLGVNSMITGAGFLFVSDSLKARVIKLLSKPLYKYGLNCASSVIFQNQDDLKEFKENGLIKVEKSYVINGSGVNMKQFVCTALPKQMTFLMISRFIYSKGVLEYFKAAERIKSIYPEVRFIIIGDIDGKADSLSYAEVRYCLENGIVEQVSFTKDVPGYMQQTSVYVLPSYREGTPRSVLEAMACGRPILTTDVPGCRNTVVEGKNGFLVPAKDVDALVDKMSWFITHQEALVPMGRASWELCEERFDVHKVNKAINQIMGI